MAEQTAIEVDDLCKRFKVYRKASDLVLELLSRKPRHQEFWALKNVAFQVRQGEMVGIIGKNGSGKSTLLKILAGTLDSTRGQIRVNGKVSAILELGTGFHPERTGRENVVLGGMCLGMSKKEVLGKLDAIVAFSGVGEFIDRPFRTYSSGMQARLTFATATAVQPDILIVDEALATGDGAFVYKCLERIREIGRSGCTTLLVSHDLGLLAKLCRRVIWLDRGQVKRDGNAVDVLRDYHLSVVDGMTEGQGRVEPVFVRDNTILSSGDLTLDLTAGAERSAVFKRGPIEITLVELLDGTGQKTWHCKVGMPITIRAHYRCNGAVPEESLGLAVAINQTDSLLCVCQFNTHCYADDADVLDYDRAPHRTRPGKQGVIEARINQVQLKPGNYYLSVGLLPNLHDSWQFYEYHHLAYRFHVAANGWASGGVFQPDIQWMHHPRQEVEAAA
jgi:ABC-type polysaccharide/polyol phosphate transport system ATPase subunit